MASLFQKQPFVSLSEGKSSGSMLNDFSIQPGVVSVYQKLATGRVTGLATQLES